MTRRCRRACASQALLARTGLNCNISPIPKLLHGVRFLAFSPMDAMIDALIFDKDGTLFDFRQSWGEVTHSLAAKLGPYGPGQAALESFLGYDPVAGDFHPDSPVIAQTTPEIAALLHPLLDGISLDEVNDLMNHLAQNTPMVPAVPLRPVLLELWVGGRKLGLATNDTEVPREGASDPWA